MADGQAGTDTGPGRLRVVNLGLPKSGTTTLGVALTRAGLKVADWRIRKPQTDDPGLVNKFVARLLYDGYFQTGDPLHHMQAFDAFTEISLASHGHCLWPQSDWGLIDAIRRHHPGTRFLLSHREPGELVDSMMRWSNLGRRRLPQQNVPGLPTGYGRTEAELIRWIEGHYAFCRQVFAGADDFLEYTLSDPDAPERISGFIGLDLPWWGQSNIGSRDDRAASPGAVGTKAAPAQKRRAPRPVFIHGGAHRTGTSSFQLCLSANRAALAGAGYCLAFPSRDDVPDGALRLKLPEPRHGARQVMDFTARASAEIDRHLDRDGPLILSEENLVGRMIHIHHGRFYPAAARRARALCEALPGPLEHLLLVVRCYDSFYVSCYRKRAEEHPVQPFEKLKPAFMGMNGGWSDLIETLRDVLRPRRFSVIDYSARGSNVGLLQHLVPGLETSGLAEPDRQLNASATDAALADLQARYRAGETLLRRERRQVMLGHGDDTGERGFAAFSGAETSQLQERYARDLERIAALEGVELIRG